LYSWNERLGAVSISTRGFQKQENAERSNVAKEEYCGDCNGNFICAWNEYGGKFSGNHLISRNYIIILYFILSVEFQLVLLITLI